MLFLSRATGPVATAIVLFALLGMSSPSKAWDLTRTPIAAAVTAIPTIENLSDTVPVPTPAMKPATDATPDEVALSATPVSAPGLAFASLAAAVAAQNMPGDMDSELSCLAGRLEPGQHEHQRDGDDREDEAENQRCALPLHRIELHSHTVVRQRRGISPVPEKVRRYLESAGQVQSHDSIPYLRVGSRRTVDSPEQDVFHRGIYLRLLTGYRGDG